ncbi:hypothetical protein GGR51DRAFT_519117 [Nemania sp. FL0031]|nr:hypothetical protein GGR51DRAFT_519117 [Nemania sp. FL0031]
MCSYRGLIACLRVYLGMLGHVQAETPVTCSSISHVTFHSFNIPCQKAVATKHNSIRPIMEELQVEVILDILKESCHGMLEELLSPEFQKMKELVPEKWSDAVDILTQIRRNYLKRCLSEDHTLLIKGYLTASEDSPVIGALVAFRMTEAEMWKKEDETQKLADSIVQTLEKKPVGVGDVLGAKPEEYSTKLLAWSTDGPRVIAMAVAENLALMRATRGFKTFWRKRDSHPIIPRSITANYTTPPQL